MAQEAQPPLCSSRSWRVKTVLREERRKPEKARRARRTRRERKPRKVEKERALATKAWKALKVQRTCHQWALPHPAPSAPSRVSGRLSTLMATTTLTELNSAPLSTTAATR